MEKIKIQTIVFPKETKHMMCRSLFYHGENGYLDREKGCLTLGVGQKCDLTTYINSCSWAKWQKYTNAEEIILSIEIEGTAELRYVGYSMVYQELERKEFGVQRITRKERDCISYRFPHNCETIIGVEITAIENCIIYGGSYEVEYKNNLNDIHLSIATTTCKKEEYIKRNIRLIQEELLNGPDEIKDHLTVHVVDNGSTLKESDVCDDNILLHPNPNTGGSGGFARGMIETLHQRPEATHILLMDDDVLVLPESIRRTFNLLRLLKEDYIDYFINGAMLKYERPCIQHEDIGTVRDGGWFEPLKPSGDFTFLHTIVRNEGAYYNARFQYSAWWFCCIPAIHIKKNGLPFPFFLRVDDSEYSLRCKARIMTLNGICIWHQDFEPKYNNAVDIYMQRRNMFIAQAASGVMQGIDLHKGYVDEFYRKLYKFEYGGAELALQALEDYLKGPSFIEGCNGEQVLNEKRTYNEKRIPLENYESITIRDPWRVYEDEPRRFIDKLFFHLTLNGHRFTPEFLYKKHMETIVAAYGATIQTQKITRIKEYVAVDVFSETCAMRRIDKKRGQQLIKRFKKNEKYYRRKHVDIDNAYRESQKRLTSEEFWKTYLGLDNVN